VGMLLGVALAVAMFAVCVWGGRTLSRHYNDRMEVVAALVVAASVIAPIALFDGAGVPFMAAACALGLMMGYNRNRRA
jgi:hypothetical protein